MNDVRHGVGHDDIQQDVEDRSLPWLNFARVFAPDEFGKRGDGVCADHRLFVADTFKEAVPEEIVCIFTANR